MAVTRTVPQLAADLQLTPRVLVSALPAVPAEVEVGALVGPPVAITSEPAGG